MAKRTRVFLFAAAGVLLATLATGLIAWASGVSVFAALGSNVPAELAYVPSGANMVAYADVRELMNSPLRDRVREFQRRDPSSPDGLEARTGIRFDRDIDRVVIATVRSAPVTAAKDQSLLIARGRFDATRIEGLMRDQGGAVEQYRGKRVVAIDEGPSLSFVEPGLLLFGSRDDVRSAIDVKAGAASDIGANAEFMALVNDVSDGNAWSVAKFDSLSGGPGLPSAVMSQLPPINWLAASGKIDDAVHGFVRAEARDERSAQDLRDVVQGFLALARMQGAREAGMRGLLDSVQMNAQGKSVSLTFELTPAALDVLSSQGGVVRRR